MYKCALVLAAGQGKRIKSDLPKVLHKVCGKEMVNHVIDTIRKAGIQDANIIIGKGAELVKERTEEKKVTYSLQSEQLGTGHAVQCASEFLKGKKGTVAVFAGDTPLIKESTIKNLFNTHIEAKNAATILTAIVDDPTGYGRIIRSGNEVLKIVEHKDCNEEELKVNEMNSAIYCFDIKLLYESLSKLSNNNEQGEYYLTDVIEILKSAGHNIGAVVTDFEETIGVNSRAQLAQAEEILKDRINIKHMENGVTLIDPKTTYIGIDVEIGKDTIIYPNNIFEGNTIIGERCTIYQNSRIKDSIVKDEVDIQSSVILDSSIGNNTTVGPFAYIRPESKIGERARIGDFVEIKKSIIGDGTKVSHLTYIGDAEVGKECNFGCGTVVVNYDGKKKYKTIIGNHSFIGCNTNLVSPVQVGDNTYIAAGSTITSEVQEGDLAVARAKQRNIKGWVDKKGLKK
ncbi:MULTISPECIES: bifunctional UDP-N-acetylglucosamine diphosphorylase/glucosamine-1-phosphate N-acetyltransferase GlmU [unclassified Clostridium]|uniref:bifunctional UDP-N-acetylglucosamine diphosphorylase/glucosamine-1-phosphate N-acetyltransferase GlmU n=1 Tax=unclassified Clostridium TaxID=2614128 RepID=UPI0013FA7FEB|nr:MULTISPECIES: bifunctional UDP-N-acetylglucosamine diphosphorylase/glucosamine-1-phosphate N-acetyltransferase GlmU [unclassified Clostridium]NFR86107.1 bifunctional UDP-N-acetylglucosamine diphosphorylase/glucosamine-1-phosphate N-acetyltransferase GlmU [Clostridium botulinum]NFR90172.1 bifunctional UDP-N-acetylglucosamine diphosphorylase/glucosamine-1-phosphate N-acetyltransferase GlmU [Clostridium botulinum]NFU00083.1 bifunctional UDP-N-acetylglucosamine diphosphorylase/glucosamine-1-phosp